MNYLKKLQAKPFAQRLRILKIASVVTAVLILAIWGLTLKFRATEKGDTSKLQEIWNNVRELKSKFK